MEAHQPDPSQLRISDADRHRVAEVLRGAAGEGRLDLEELDERLDATFAAKVYADLVPIVADLPEGAGNLPAPLRPEASPARFRTVTPGTAVPAVTHDSSITVMGGVDRKGVWRIGASHTAFCLMGGVLLDLRQAEFTAPETVIHANAVMGGIDIVVNAGTRVVCEGIGIMGAYEETNKVLPELDDHSPVVRVKGIALMGAVTILRREMPGEPKPPRLPRSQR